MRVLYKKQIFEQYKEISVVHGQTLVEILDDLGYPEPIRKHVQIRANGSLISPTVWSMARPNQDVVTSIAVVPGDADSGTEILKTAVTIAVAYYTGQPTNGVAASGWLVAGATLATGLALNALFPPPQPGLTKNPDRTSVNTITGQSNKSDPYGVVIRNYGLNKIYPRVVAEPFTYYVGNDQYLIGIYDFGLDEQAIQEATLQLGESGLLEFEGVEYNIAHNPSELGIYKNKTSLESFTALFENIGDSSIRTSPDNSESIELKFDFPIGLTTIVGSNRVQRETTVKLSVKVKRQSSSFWSDFSSYDFEIDKAYELDTVLYYPVSFKPQSMTLVSSYTTSGSFFADTTWRITNSGNTVTFKVDLDPTLDTRPPRINDSIIIPYGNNGPRESVSRILSITNETSLGAFLKEYTCTVSEVVNFDQIITFKGSDFGSYDLDYPIKTQIRSLNDVINIKANTLSAFRFNLKINFNSADTWDVWVYWENTTVDNIGSSPDFIDDFVWNGILGYTQSLPISTEDNHTYLELKVKATDQLSGTIDNLSALAYSVLDYYDDVSLSWKRKETNNPAWVFVDILTGNLNQRSISKDRIDLDSISTWASYCESNSLTYQGNTAGFECNFVLDYTVTVKELLAQVCSTGRATLNINNGKYGVIIDEERTTPVQLFNQRNIISMKVARDYVKTPDAISCKFIDPASGWQKNEVVAYDDGKDFSSAETIEEIEMFATTQLAQAWRQGRYFLAQQKLRRNNVIIDVDFENLACSRGDLVLFSHDVMKIGGLPTRVISISGNLVTLDEPVSDQGGSYILRARVRATDSVVDVVISSFTGTQQVEVVSVGSLQVDDLVVFGETDTATREYLVKTITYADEFSASLNLIEHAPEIYDADTGIIPDYTVVTQGDPLAGEVYPGPVENLTHIYEIKCNTSEKRYLYQTDISWDPPSNNPVDNYEIYLEVNGQQQLIGFTKNRTFTYLISSLLLETEHNFKVIGVDGAGRKMPLQNASSISFTPFNDTVRPEDIQEFNANILTETIQLDWRLVTDCDIDRYYIRYSPKTSGAIWAQSTIVTSTANNQNSVQVPLRTGTYFVKAQDWAGNISTTAAFLKTQVPEVLNVEFITEIDAPGWDGTYEETELIGTKLKLRSTDNDITYASSIGNFYFNEIIDLGDVFTSRFTSSLLAGGYSATTIMSNWTTMASVDPIAGVFTEDDFDAATYIRTKNIADVMSDWTTLSGVDYLSFGNEVTATPWQRFTNADFTGRIFQFKLQLEGNDDQTVSPVVFESNIVANWTERVTDGKDVVSGTVVEFDNAFVNVPAIQVTSSENIATGDYHNFTNKDENGFTVQFYNSSDVPISTPKYDWIAKGVGKKYTLDDINF